ncbi:hypothetical protein VNO77_19628 [Canavalia gladiata]|uniref:Non-specific serine/threonine protein kinase n=1 Tax=Canavalia gladiata TaxID=3824 RepID=A0AAN9LRW5_CANGL
MGFINRAKLCFVLFMLCCYLLYVVIAIDTVTSSQSIKDPETLSSKDGNFSLGFFSPENSTNRYVGIWWKSQSKVIWVANRNQPLNDSSGVVTISEDGNLVVLNGERRVIWSSNVSDIVSNTSSQFSDFGKLVLMGSTTGNILWDSFQQPSNTLLPGMKLSSNENTGEKVELRSWKSPSNPSVGSFSSSAVARLNIPQVFIWNETKPIWRSGPWNGQVFIGVPTMGTYFPSFHGGDDGEGNTEIYFTKPSVLDFFVYVLNPHGQYEETLWDDEKKEMVVTWSSRESDCDVYGMCGPFASCNPLSSPICSCLRGFEPSNTEEWNTQNWTNGCVRREPLQCERVKEQNTVDGKEDGFLKLQMVKVPDFPAGSPFEPEICRSQCLENCSCVAYSHFDGIGCMSWTGNLLDIQQFSSGGIDLYVRIANPQNGNKAYIMFLTLAKRWHSIKSTTKENTKTLVQFYNGETAKHTSHKVIEELSEVKLQELLLFKLEELETATHNFHLSNELGKGGFGPVYKGKLQDGQEIAVKRLSRASGQGVEEFMNEVVVISKLQHRNLVKLLGCCVEGDEKMLIYEYMPNKSLDVWIQWRKGNISSLIDPAIYDPSDHKHVLRCIHIGLLCVQELAIERPIMATVISMLNSEIAFLPPPSEPAFIRRQTMLNLVSSKESDKFGSVSTFSITDVCGR